MTVARYSLPARLLHWAVAAGIVTAVGIALAFDDLPLSPTRIRLLNYHKWAGVTVLFLVLIRIAVRLRLTPPALPATMRSWELKLAAATHHLLYALMALVPVFGWLASSAKGFPPVWFGIVHLPALLEKNKAVADVLQPIHTTLAWTLVALVVLHVVAALKHRFVDRDQVLDRMSF
jgi:cytochrome b561